MDAYKPIPMFPLTGILDAQSTVDAEPQGAFTAKRNVEVSPSGKLSHAQGFAKPYGINPFLQNVGGIPCDYKNWDFHNQGVAVADREPPTLLFWSTTNDGIRQLFLGTKTRIALFNELAGSWGIVSPAGLGIDGAANKTQTRFMAAELQNKVFFTNGLDSVLYYDLITNAVAPPVPGLATAGESGGAVTKARVVVEWQGVVFLMNFVEDGKRLTSRIRWSDLNNGLDWGAAPSSISDFQDLDYGEIILNAVPLNSSLYVFTNKSIWRCNFVIDTQSGTAILNCVRFYNEPKNQDKCLAYPHTLISTGFEIYYAGVDAIYEYDPYKAQPEATEWIFRASSIIYDDEATAIDTTCCNSPIAEYHPLTKEIHFSWPSPDAVQIASSDCNAIQPIQGSGINRHTLVINLGFTTCDYRDYGSTAMVNFKSDIGADGNCNQNTLFLGASGIDFALKQFGVGFAREIYDPLTDTFSMRGYYPLLRGVFPFGSFTEEKSIKSFRIDAIADGDTGTVFKLRIGTSYKTVNPNLNNGNCGVLWKSLSSKPIKCPDKMTPEAYAAKNIRPTDDYLWKFLYRGRFLYYEITITAPDGTAPKSGGVELSRFDVEAIQL